MIAILTRSGAFLYNISKKDFAHSISHDKLVGWLFQNQYLISQLESLSCEAVYIDPNSEINNKGKYICITDFSLLDEAYDRHISKRGFSERLYDELKKEVLHKEN